MALTTLALALLAGALLILNVLAVFWAARQLYPALRGGGPYVPSPDAQAAEMLRMAQIQPADVVVDLGSGDGRLVIAAAKAGAKRAVGYEIYGHLVKKSRAAAAQAGVADRTDFRHEDMWHADLAGATVILLYQLPHTMKRLKRLILSQAAPGTRIVSNAFVFPDWEPIETRGAVRLYVVTQNAARDV